MFNFGKNNLKNTDTTLSLNEYIGIINMMSKNNDSTIAQILNSKDEIISIIYVDHIEYCQEDNLIYLKRLINNKYETVTAIIGEFASNIKYKVENQNNYSTLVLNILCNSTIKRDKSNKSTIDDLSICNYINKMNQLSKAHDVSVLRLFNKKGSTISITEINELEYIENSKMIEFKKDINNNLEAIGVLNNFFIKDINYNSNLNKSQLNLTIDIVC